MASSDLNQFLSENRNKKIVFTNGCFDLIHVGHIAYLNEAKALGDILIVGLNSDASVRELKGSQRPIVPENERKIVLENLKSVDYVEIFDESTPLELIKVIRPQVLVKGGDWKIQNIVGHDFVVANGGEVRSLKFLKGKSSTNLIEKIKKI